MFLKCQIYVAWIVLAVIVLLGLTGWSSPVNPAFDPAFDAQKFLSACFDPSKDTAKLKKWEIQITDKGFFRLKKYFHNGKQEYFSFNLGRFKDMDYWGVESGGTLCLKTSGENIIVQTYNDPRGNVDSMSSSLSLHLRNVEAPQLHNLYENLKSFRK